MSLARHNIWLFYRKPDLQWHKKLLKDQNYIDVNIFNIKLKINFKVNVKNSCTMKIDLIFLTQYSLLQYKYVKTYKKRDCPCKLQVFGRGIAKGQVQKK